MKNILITGGSNGIGKSCVEKYLNNGDRVFILDIEDSSFENNNLYFYKCNIGKYEEVKKCFEDINNKCENIDVIINCAGIQIIDKFENYDYDSYLKVFNTNYFGTCNVIHSFLPLLKEGSTILNILSVHSFKPRMNKYAYDSSKASNEMLTKELALEFASKNITVNALSFGAVNTNMNKEWTKEEKEATLNKVPLKIIFEPDQIANFAFNIVRDYSKYTTGSVFIIDGGRSLM